MKISIVTINYNNLGGLKETVASVLSQDYPDLEYIIIDGGSSDGSREFIESVETDRISYSVSEKDGGLYDAMNKGLKVADGEYVLFMNSGDRFFKPSSLTHLEEGAKESGADVVYGSALYSYPEGCVLRKPQTLDVMARELPFCHQAVMVRTALAKEAPFNERLRFIADYDMFYKLWKSEKNFKAVDNIISVYDASGISASNANSRSMFEERCLIHNNRYSEFSYRLDRLKSDVKDIARCLLPLGFRNRLLGRKSNDLNLRPLDYFEAHYN